MPDAHAPTDDALSQPATDARPWLHTVKLALVFLVLAILAEAIGTGHEQTTAVVRQRSPSTTAATTARDAPTPVRVISVAAKPAPRR